MIVSMDANYIKRIESFVGKQVNRYVQFYNNVSNTNILEKHISKILKYVPKIKFTSRTKKKRLKSEIVSLSY